MSDRRSALREPKQRAPRTARADRAQETGRRLIDAAAKVVGAEGYSNASVAKITALADVAQGTFYNYFATQQDLFDHLLPELGGEMLDFIRERVKGIKDSFAREEAGFRAFFEFLQARPEFYRILNEAETFSPKAFRAHMRNMAQGYLRALSRSHAKGELPGFTERELEVVVYVLLAARNYIAYRYVAGEGRPRTAPAWVTDAYIKLVTGGMRFGGTARRPTRRTGRQSEAAHSRSAGLDYRLKAEAPGRVEIELDVDTADQDDNGLVRSALLMDLIETATGRAAANASDRPLQLESMSFGFMARTAARKLVASAHLESSGKTLHVTARIVNAAAPHEVLATAQAAYALDAGREP